MTKYSIDEIDRMRTAISRSYPKHVSFRQTERDAQTEDRLRTLMLNGSTVEEVEAWSRKLHNDDHVMWAVDDIAECVVAR